jgi:hypothetical protein
MDCATFFQHRTRQNALRISGRIATVSGIPQKAPILPHELHNAGYDLELFAVGG